MNANIIAPIITAAEEYAQRGWSVFPVKADKKPAVSAWKNCQTTAAKPEDVAAWFGRVKTTAGVAIVLGPVSGHLYVRDYDDPDEYHRWRTDHPDLAATLPTVRTHRGYHVYARWPGVATATMPGGELRGAGAYVVAPPSRNAHGGVYEWVVPLPNGLLPEVDPFAVGLAVAKVKKAVRATERTELTELSERTERTETTEDTQDIQDPEAIWGGPAREKIENAITRWLPTAFGRRNLAIFGFARALKAFPHLCNIGPAQVKRLKPIVRAWYDRALASIITKDWAVTWGDFAHAWGRVRIPEGADAIGEALQAAEAADPPDWSSEYQGRCRLLAALCRELQRRAGDAPFFLSARKAGECVGTDAPTAARWFKAFIADGALELVTAGTLQSLKASRYRYHEPDQDPEAK